MIDHTDENAGSSVPASNGIIITVSEFARGSGDLDMNWFFSCIDIRAPEHWDRTASGLSSAPRNKEAGKAVVVPGLTGNPGKVLDAGACPDIDRGRRHDAVEHGHLLCGSVLRKPRLKAVRRHQARHGSNISY